MEFSKKFNPQSFCDAAKEEVKGKNKSQTWAILAKYFTWTKEVSVWNENESKTENQEKEYRMLHFPVFVLDKCSFPLFMLPFGIKVLLLRCKI